MRNGKEHSSNGDVQQLKDLSEQHPVVEVALVRPQGEGDYAAEVTNHTRESNNNLDIID